ncbi:MAG: hypothetical protein U1E40_14985 [Amaricoccus sp.]
MPVEAHSVRAWLHGLLAGLVALAAIVAPAQHERMMSARAVTTPAAAARMRRTGPTRLRTAITPDVVGLPRLPRQDVPAARAVRSGWMP